MKDHKNNNLSTFSILFLIKGILTLIFSIIPLFYVFIGMKFFGSETFSDSDMPFDFSSLFIAIGLIGFFFFLVLGIISILTSKYLKERRNFQFVFVVSILNGLTGMLGILLAVFTVIELNKPEVKSLFEGEEDLNMD